tara:strand:- start:1338 stop:1652 length:315 start_codon:yes stop_codon:yes gene_type:complete
MTNLIVLFNLRDGVDPLAYEVWARATDLPIVRALKSVTSFSLYKSMALIGSDDKPPYDYIEMIAIDNMEDFGEDVGSSKMQSVAEQFQTFADAPIFIMTKALDG